MTHNHRLTLPARGRRLTGLLAVGLVIILVLAACDIGADQNATATTDILGEATPVAETTVAPLGEETAPAGVTETMDVTDTTGTTGTTGVTDTTTTTDTTDVIGAAATVEATATTLATDTVGMTSTPETMASPDPTGTPGTGSGEAPGTLPETGQSVTGTVGISGTNGVGVSVARVAQPGGRLEADIDVQLVKIADGLVDPINVVSAPDGSGRLFVIERPGIIRIVQDGQLLEEPFLDISHLVVSAFLEQGLYDMAFDPDFAGNGYFYLHFSELMRNGDSVIVRYSVSDEDENVADTDSDKLILEIPQPWANHNGGEIEFGPDGYLYIGSGDGGWEGDPLEAGQDLSTLLGKILRIDVNVDNSESRAYAIPADNPFASQAGLIRLFGIPEDEFAAIHTEARPEIWAWGLRNPWKFNFDPETGDLYIADVGQNHWEEINFQPADSQGGENYGWDLLMGSHCHPIQKTDCTLFGVLPVAEYSHDLGLAVVGLGVYRGSDYPEWDGIYFVSDWGSGRIWGLARDSQGTWQMEELLDPDLHITGAGQDENGNIYVTSCNCEYSGPGPFENPPGSLWQLVPADQVLDGAETAPLDDTEQNEEGEGATVEPTGTPEAGATAGDTPSPDATAGATASPGATAGAGEDTVIELAAQNTQFDTDTITVPAGARVVIEFTNMDAVGHNFAAYMTSDAQDPIFVGDIIVGPNQTITYEFDAPTEPGTYYFQCDPHAFTMNGSFIVE